VIPIGLVPVVSGDLRVSFDGFVDQSAKPGSKRKLVSNGRLRLGEVEYPIAKETLTVKKTAAARRVQRQASRQGQDGRPRRGHGDQCRGLHDFEGEGDAVQRSVKKANVGGVTAEVVEP
jgi:hypothetical protein